MSKCTIVLTGFLSDSEIMELTETVADKMERMFDSAYRTQIITDSETKGGGILHTVVISRIVGE